MSGSAIVLSKNIFDIDKFDKLKIHLEEVDTFTGDFAVLGKRLLNSNLFIEIANYMRISNTGKFSLLTASKMDKKGKQEEPQTITEYIIQKVGSSSYLVRDKETQQQLGYLNMKCSEEAVMLPKEIRSFVEDFMNSTEEQKVFNFKKNGYRIYKEDSEFYMEHIYTGFVAKIKVVNV